MTRRGKELADQMAVRHLELTGVSKAYGAVVQLPELADAYLPVGESLAALEKSVKIQQQTVMKTVTLAGSILEYGDRLIEQERVFLSRLQAHHDHQQNTSPWANRNYVPDSQPVTVPEVNGSTHITNSTHN